MLCVGGLEFKSGITQLPLQNLSEDTFIEETILRTMSRYDDTFAKVP